jgi:UDP-N-acetylmuramoyl-tripeptide--D-alanyl-D-alanine ligase
VVWILCVIEALAAAPLLVRLLRVAQREHYVPGSVLTTLIRWCLVVPANTVFNVTLDTLLVVALITQNRWVALVGVVGIAWWPLGLKGWRGVPKLARTGRLTRLGLLLLVVGAVAGVVLWAVGLRVEVALATAIMAAPIWIEVALWIVRPIESAMLGVFVKAAEKKLRQLAPDVVAITGSYGKTSVKEHVRDLVGATRQLTASPASFNNQAGLARTVNDYLTPGTAVLVCEMGTYGPGEIAAMCDWVRPRVSAITRIGPVHLERMKTLEGIRDAKAEILVGAEVAVLNVDDPLLAPLADGIQPPQRVIRCSIDAASGADVVVATAPDGQVTVVIDGQTVATVPSLPTGVHASNVAIALGCAVALGADPAVVPGNLGALLPPAHRLDPATNDHGLVVLDDTFNSNPDGAQAALDALIAVPGAGRRVVVTPGMVELGPIQADENTRFAHSVAEVGAELVVVGRVNRRALVAGYDAGRPPVIVKERAEAVAWVRSELGSGDAVLYENDLPDHYP